MGDFFAELRRRHIYRIGAGYTIVAWGVTQVLVMFAILAGCVGLLAELPESGIVVSLSMDLSEPASGRLLVFAKPVTEGDGAVPSVDANEMAPTSVAVSARNVATFGDDGAITLDADAEASPTPFSQLPPSLYRVQAVLDRNHDYARYGRGPGDLVSDVATVRLPLSEQVVLALSRVVPDANIWAPQGADPATLALLEAARPRLHDVVVVSPSLSAFVGTPTALRAWVLLPYDYDADPDRRFATVYFNGAYSSNRERDVPLAALIAERDANSQLPPMIWVFLDFSTPTGATEFADGVNNGPWGQALTQELLPEIERRFRTRPTRDARFLLGHSSGGWSAIWLQLKHPELFGGAWATAPDPTDFRDFLGVDLYAPDANLYRDETGTARPFIRSRGEDVATMRDYVRLLDVLGPVGGTMTSFDWVFSPRAPDGRPQPMFDHATGAVDVEVVDYWARNYDIARFVEAHAQELAAAVAGRVHVVVGEEDNFRLEGSAHGLHEAFERAGIAAEFTFLADRNHNNLYRIDDDPFALLAQIARSMTEVSEDSRE